jgi:hypothetical protein
MQLDIAAIDLPHRFEKRTKAQRPKASESAQSAQKLQDLR